jgi:uncharacterized membrane protein YeaQ/YmgE (transglycosylase-associated protein family)
MVEFILWAVIVGFIVGALARLLVPGRDPMGCFGTILLGVAGSFVGGLLYNLVFRGRVEVRPAGFIGSVVGAIILLLISRLLFRRATY